MSVCACVCVCPRLFRNEMCVRVSSAEEKVSALASLKVFFLNTPKSCLLFAPHPSRHRNRNTCNYVWCVLLYQRNVLRVSLWLQRIAVGTMALVLNRFMTDLVFCHTPYWRLIIPRICLLPCCQARAPWDVLYLRYDLSDSITTPPSLLNNFPNVSTDIFLLVFIYWFTT